MTHKFATLTRKEVDAMLGLAIQKTRVYREIKEEGREEGKQEGQCGLILKQLTRRFGQRKIKKSIRSHIESLSVQQLEALGENLLDFETIQDLTQWLEAQT
jgi:predicted transposase YdaD